MSPATLFRCSLLLLTGLALLPRCVRAQETAAAGPPIRIHQTEDAVRLYWLPESGDRFARWHDGGYRLERRRLGTDGVSAWEPLTAEPVTVAPRATFASLEYEFREQITSLAYGADGRRLSYQAQGLEGEALMAFLEGRRQALFFITLNTADSWESALAFGVAYEDRTIVPGEAYRYRITPVAEPAAASTVAIRTGRPTRLPPVDDVRAAWGDRTVEVSWRNAGGVYFGFRIFRRVFGEQAWTALPDGNLLDVDPLNERTVFTDTLPDNDTVFEYAIQGLGWLGYDGPQAANVRGQGSVEGYPPQPIVYAEDAGDGRFRIDWTFPTDADTAVISYFTVQRGLTPTGGLSLISTALPAGARTFTDSIVSDEVWYRVVAHGRRGTDSPSARQHVIADDTIPPPPVTGLRGDIDRDGLVVLNWDPSAAKDAIGYRVWFSNGADREGTRRTDTLEVQTNFRDTLDLTAVNDTVYYRVAALDERENVGAWSEPLALPIPDIIPPAPPRLRSFRADTNGVRFSYAPSSSDDVVGYTFERRARFTDYWEAFATLPPVAEVSTFLDGSGADDITYEYRLIAFDEQGLRGVSNVLAAKRQMRMLFPAVEDLVLRARPADPAIELTWLYPEDQGIASFRVYRASPSGDLKLYRTLDANNVDRRRANDPDLPAQWRFLDEDIRRDTQYRYAVVAVYRTGAESRTAPAVTIDF